MTDRLSALQEKYPHARSWSFGDSAQLADELVELVIRGEKRATCGSFVSYQQENPPVVPGDFHIVLNGAGIPACVIRTTALRLLRFNEVTPELAAAEGEGDKSLAWWREAHQAFFHRAGAFTPDMELIYEEFTLIEVCE